LLATRSALAALAAVLATAGPALASPPAQEGPSVSLRAGYAIPLGAIFGSQQLGDVFTGQVPVEIAAGYWFTPNWYLGGYFQYGIGVLNALTLRDVSLDCSPADVYCHGRDLRLGIEAAYHLRPGQTVEPWFGLGLGYEWANLQHDAPGTSIQVSVHGLEFARGTFGVDFRVSSRVSLGPYVTASLGSYGVGSLSVTGNPPYSLALPERKFHGWVTFALQATLNL
jgi:outer membrane protein W